MGIAAQGRFPRIGVVPFVGSGLVPRLFVEPFGIGALFVE